MTRVGPRKSVDPDYWRRRRTMGRDYLRHARDALALAELGDNCAPAVSQAILAVVAYVDALTAYRLQQVNQQAHAGATGLLRAALGRELPDVQERRVRRLIARKDEVQYGVVVLTRQRAEEFVEDVEALVQWADGLLP